MNLLEVSNLSKSFGGVSAVSELTFSVKEGHVHSIIGPNGAGKTTLINLLTGVYTPTSGRIRLGEHDIQGIQPHDLAKLGMSRTFQNLQICMNMSALENVMIGRHLRLDRRFLPALLHLPSVRKSDRDGREKAAELMTFVGLEAYIGRAASALSYGALKRLEIARALAAEPHLLLLDEPAAGLNANETVAVERLIRRVAGAGDTVMLVEHDMRLVMNVSDTVLVLNYGKKLAQGSAEEVQRNPDVVSAYLGAA